MTEKYLMGRIWRWAGWLATILFLLTLLYVISQVIQTLQDGVIV